MDALYMDSIQLQLENNFSELYSVGALCASHYDVAKAMTHSSLVSRDAKVDCLTAQKAMESALTATNMNKYVDRLVVFNEYGMVVQAENARQGGHQLDFTRIVNSQVYQNETLRKYPRFVLTDSIVPGNPQCFAALFQIVMQASGTKKAYVYVEVALSAFTNTVEPYVQSNFLWGIGDIWSYRILLDQGENDLVDAIMENGRGQTGDCRYAGHDYDLDTRDIAYTDLTLCSATDLTELSLNNRNITITLLVVIFTGACVGFGVMLILSRSVTKPIRCLIARIKKISANDFSYDPAIERSQDEIGEIGKVVNEMSLSVDTLIKESLAANTEKKNIEIAMLQAQINPHFLYNTLDSIHWMAILQKNQGIANVTKSLSNLLRNMAKGVRDKVSLREELALLEDYVVIQSVRYADSFELINQIDEKYYDCSIVKLTLQPLVENAILHGVAPLDRFGTITLDAADRGGYLYITVTDNGEGMTPETIDRMLTDPSINPKGMNGIGFAVANKRLKLIYGPECGLSVESVPGEHTTVTAKIKKERIEDV